MKRKIFAIITVLAVLISGGVLYMLNVQKSSTGLDAKEEKIIKHGFRLLEEQLGTYIKENHSGISKIEFSPIFIQGGKDNPPFTAHVLPVIYDEEGNRAVLGGQIGKIGYPRLDFDHNDNEIIELEDSAKGLGIEVDVSNAKTLPEKAKIKAELDVTDENIAALVNTKKLKNVRKNKEGSPKAEIVYNLEIKRGEYWKWH